MVADLEPPFRLTTVPQPQAGASAARNAGAAGRTADPLFIDDDEVAAPRSSQRTLKPTAARTTSPASGRSRPVSSPERTDSPGAGRSMAGTH